jgi:hypothetical protein
VPPHFDLRHGVAQAVGGLGFPQAAVDDPHLGVASLASDEAGRWMITMPVLSTGSVITFDISCSGSRGFAQQLKIERAIDNCRSLTIQKMSPEPTFCAKPGPGLMSVLSHIGVVERVGVCQPWNF